MLFDARRVPRDEVIDADVCIVGSGPAGLTLAHELAGTDVRVCVLESGGHEFDADTQDLADGRFTGWHHFEPLRNARRRQVGGMGNQWDSDLGVRNRLGFRAGPLDPIDFERREWLPYSGWPFGRAHLDPYYERTHRTLGLGPYRYDAAQWEGERARRLPLDPETFDTDVWTFVPQEVFTKRFPDGVARSANVSMYLWANVVEVEAAENAREVTGLRVACLDGNRFRVRARLFVLAAGGMENARLLLLSDGVQRGGLGNGHGVVGRFFMEHQPVHGGTLRPARRALIDEMALYDVRQIEGVPVPVIGKVVLREEVLQREQLLGLSVAFLPKHPRYRNALQAYPDSAAELARGLARLRLPENAGAHVRNVVKGIDYLGARAAYKLSRGRLCADFTAGPDMLTGGGWSAAGDASKRFAVLDVHLHVEQAPHPDNRVTLDDATDALGCRKTHLHWEWRERDYTSVRRAQKLLADGLRKAGLGEYEIASEHGLPVLEASGLHHQMGTTRMHEDPAQGVVDADCRVHGIGNLFVAGYSVFPTGGYINPTLTVVAMSLRLADHVRQVLRGDAPPHDAAAATGGTRALTS